MGGTENRPPLLPPERQTDLEDLYEFHWRVPLKIYLEFYGFTSILQGVPLRIYLNSMDLHLFCKGYPLGFTLISLNLPLFCKGYPLGFTWISMDLHIYFVRDTP